jgi:hypothetical protein
VALAAGLGVAAACSHHDPAPTAPPTRIELRDAGGRAVTLTPGGITVENGANTIEIAADAIHAAASSDHVNLTATSLEFPSSDGATALARDRLTLEHGDHKITATVGTDEAGLILGSEGLRRAVEINVNRSYASVLTTASPADHVSPPHVAQLASDENGGDLTVRQGKAERHFAPPQHP